MEHVIEPVAEVPYWVKTALYLKGEVTFNYASEADRPSVVYPDTIAGVGKIFAQGLFETFETPFIATDPASSVYPDVIPPRALGFFFFGSITQAPIEGDTAFTDLIGPIFPDYVSRILGPDAAGGFFESLAPFETQSIPSSVYADVIQTHALGAIGSSIVDVLDFSAPYVLPAIYPEALAARQFLLEGAVAYVPDAVVATFYGAYPDQVEGRAKARIDSVIAEPIFELVAGSLASALYPDWVAIDARTGWQDVIQVAFEGGTLASAYADDIVPPAVLGTAYLQPSVVFESLELAQMDTQPIYPDVVFRRAAQTEVGVVEFVFVTPFNAELVLTSVYPDVVYGEVAQPDIGVIQFVSPLDVELAASLYPDTTFRKIVQAEAGAIEPAFVPLFGSELVTGVYPDVAYRKAVQAEVGAIEAVFVSSASTELATSIYPDLIPFRAPGREDSYAFTNPYTGVTSQATARYGAPTGNVDLPEDFVTIIDQVPWIEFRTSILFYPLSGSPNQTLDAHLVEKTWQPRDFSGSPNQTLDLGLANLLTGPFVRNMSPFGCDCAAQATNFQFQLGTVLPRSLDLSTLTIEIAENEGPLTLAYDGGLGGFQSGFSGSVTSVPSVIEDLRDVVVNPDLNLIGGTVLRVRITCDDDLGNPIEPAIEWSFPVCVVIDVVPPVVTPISPEADELNVVPDAEISFEVTDVGGTGVDLLSLQVGIEILHSPSGTTSSYNAVINGVIQAPWTGSITPLLEGYAVELVPPVPLQPSSTITVTVDASDFGT